MAGHVTLPLAAHNTTARALRRALATWGRDGCCVPRQRPLQKAGVAACRTLAVPRGAAAAPTCAFASPCAPTQQRFARRGLRWPPGAIGCLNTPLMAVAPSSGPPVGLRPGLAMKRSALSRRANPPRVWRPSRCQAWNEALQKARGSVRQDRLRAGAGHSADLRQLTSAHAVWFARYSRRRRAWQQQQRSPGPPPAEASIQAAGRQGQQHQPASRGLHAALGSAIKRPVPLRIIGGLWLFVALPAGAIP